MSAFSNTSPWPDLVCHSVKPDRVTRFIVANCISAAVSLQSLRGDFDRHHRELQAKEPFNSARLKGGEKQLAKGSVVKRAGCWYAVYRINGRQRWEAAGPSKKRAERLLVRRVTEVYDEAVAELKKATFADFAEMWLQDYAKMSVKQSTYISYETITRRHLLPNLGKLWLHQISGSDIQRLLARKIRLDGLSPKSVVNILIPLKEMLQHAIEWGYLRSNPAAFVKRPHVEIEEMDFLSPDEICLLLEHVNSRYQAFFMAAVLTGMRRGELLALKWGDIDWNSSQISVRRSLYRGVFQTPKSTYSFRRIMLSPMLIQTLMYHRTVASSSELDLVFCDVNGRPLDPDNLVKRQFLTALDRAGIRRIRFHDLRHTYASLLIAQGEDIKFVQAQLGHSSAKTTLDRYGHLFPGTHKESARRLDQTVFGNSVRRLLEEPANQDSTVYKKAPEGVALQGLNSGSGGRI